MATYRKIVVDADHFGSKDFDEATKIVAVPRILEPAPGHITVKVIAAGVQASDIIQMAGGYGVLASEKPATSFTGEVQPGDLGCEGVGRVIAVGAGVDPALWSLGVAVAWWGYGSAFREEVTFPTDLAALSALTTTLTRVPDTRSEWTALGVSALTASGGLELVGRIRPGMSVLVTGAAGGTGHMACQWAKHVHGAKVAGTCGGQDKVEMLKSLGVDVAVNYRTQDVYETLHAAFPAGFDIIYDGVGGRVGVEARRLLGETGVVVGIGSASTDYSGKSSGDADNLAVTAAPKLGPQQREEFFFCPNGPKMAGQKVWDKLVADTVDAMASGKVRVVLDAECKGYWGLEGVYAAQRRMRSGLNVGKIFAEIVDDATYAGQ